MAVLNSAAACLCTGAIQDSSMLATPTLPRKASESADFQPGTESFGERDSPNHQHKSIEHSEGKESEMKPSIIDVIADQVLKSAPELQDRLQYQAEALEEHKCTQPVLGHWIDENDVKYLLSSFALGDKDFAARFPAMGQVSEATRQRLLQAFDRHFESCVHCSLKRGYDLELDARIKQTCKEESHSLLELLGAKGNNLREAEPVASPLESVLS
jgi:hypothetical protein